MKEEIKKRIEDVRRGEMPEGYCRRHPYVIPCEWQVVKLGSITKRISRPNNDGQDRFAYSINNRKGFVPQSEQFEEGSYEGLDKTAYKIVKKGEFAYNPARVNVGSIGRLRDAEEVVISSLYVCISIDERIDGEFFDAWTKIRDFYKETVRNTEGSVREYLFYENFANMRMPIPPLAEQQKIAEILATCDKVIGLKQKLIEEKRRQKKWLMQKLLTPQHGWEKTTIGQIASITTGATPDTKHPEYWGGSIRWMNSGELNLKRVYEVEGRITAVGLEKSGTKIIPSNCVLIGLAGQGKTRGTAAINYAELCTNQSIAAIHPGNKFDSEFLYHYLDSKYLELRKISSGDGARGGLNLELIGGFVIYLPDLTMQSKIASVLSKADKELYLLGQELEAWQQKKKALMQLLLTGLVRVKT